MEWWCNSRERKCFLQFQSYRPKATWIKSMHPYPWTEIPPQYDTNWGDCTSPQLLFSYLTSLSSIPPLHYPPTLEDMNRHWIMAKAVLANPEIIELNCFKKQPSLKWRSANYAFILVIKQQSLLQRKQLDKACMGKEYEEGSSIKIITTRLDLPKTIQSLIPWD